MATVFVLWVRECLCVINIESDNGTHAERLGCFKFFFLFLMSILGLGYSITEAVMIEYASGVNRGRKVTFLPRQYIPRVLNRDQKTKITAAETLSCTSVKEWNICWVHPHRNLISFLSPLIFSLYLVNISVIILQVNDLKKKTKLPSTVL